jgi:hypothetical protein
LEIKEKKMEYMDKSCEGQEDSVEVKLQVLNEIKELMDSRLGGKLGEMSKPKGLEVSSVKVLGDESPEGELVESPEMEKTENELGMSDEDLMKLKMARSKMLG